MRPILVSALCLAALALAGCADDAPQPRAEKPGDGRPGGGAPARIKPVRCPPDAANCRSASGRVVYVEAVDPDGDGDAHFVLASREAISGPGITVIDVARRLRPRRLPQTGDLVAAAGPVYRGSYGQRQIQADAIRIRRR